MIIKVFFLLMMVIAGVMCASVEDLRHLKMKPEGVAGLSQTDAVERVAEQLLLFLKVNKEEEGESKILKALEVLSGGEAGAAEFIPLISVILEHQLYLQAQSTLLLTSVSKKLEKFAKLDLRTLVQDVGNQKRKNTELKEQLFKANNDTNQCRRVLGQPTKRMVDNKPNIREQIIQATSDDSSRQNGASLSAGNLYSATVPHFRPVDCADLQMAGFHQSGVYNIFPFRCACSPPIWVWCDMETDGGGWTVLLSRQNTSAPINFTKSWQDYKKGFGDPDTEYWIGNELIHTLTAGRKYSLRIDANDQGGSHVWGQWDNIEIGNENARYKLKIGTFAPTSTMFDYMIYHNGSPFTTYDLDNDNNAINNCARLHGGGWWFNNCHHHHLTGTIGPISPRAAQLNPWSRTSEDPRPIQKLQFKIRPQICDKSMSVVYLNTHHCQ